MRFWGSGALRYVKSEERTPLERVTANKWGSQFALSANGGPSIHNYLWPPPKPWRISKTAITRSPVLLVRNFCFLEDSPAYSAIKLVLKCCYPNVWKSPSHNVWPLVPDDHPN